MKVAIPLGTRWLELVLVKDLSAPHLVQILEGLALVLFLHLRIQQIIHWWLKMRECLEELGVFLELSGQEAVLR